MNLLGSILEPILGSPDTGRASELSGLSREQIEKISELWGNLDAPGQEELMNQLRYYDEIDPETAEQLDAPMEILADEGLQSKQQQALAALADRQESGLTPEEVAEREKLFRSIGAQEQARDKSILQSMQERGAGTSGVEAQFRKMSSQQASQSAREQAEALNAERSRRAMEAITQSAGLAGQMSREDVARKQANEQSKQNIQQFNALQRAGAQQRNIARQYDVAGQKAGTLQQAFQNQLSKIGGQAGAYGQQSQSFQNQAQAEANAGAQGYGAGLGFLGSLVGAGAKLGASDIRLKENIEDGNKDVKEMLDNLKSYKYDYKNPEKYGEGKQLGVMAQDLEKSDLGKSFVGELPSDGEIEGNYKGIEYDKMAPTLLAGQAELNKENEDLKSRLQRLESILSQLKGR